ncbi:ATP-binding protein [Haloechinothrix halophila]|uniref:ATP-binding protein n=1 Tax=Haloechinothrix halophila TaxID=1069073 RepID=UPI0004122E51|nr:AfsR/SARP family transcriptional regulator [Haloechinothrix halophila]
MLVRVLGSIEVRSSPEQPWVQPTPQQRLVLALLVAQAGRPCSTDRLVHALWGEHATDRAPRLAQGLVSRLRCLLEPTDSHNTRLLSVPGGWTLAVAPEEVDATRFEQLAQAAAELLEQRDNAAAGRKLREAASLWRGRPFGELADRPHLVGDTVRLEEQWLLVRERLLRLRLDTGEHAEVVGVLQELVAEQPLRERLWALLMEALYASGRQADALAAYQRLREQLVDELGAEPSPELQALHAAILRHELPVSAPVPAVVSSRRRHEPASSWPCRRDLRLVERARELSSLRAALATSREGRRQVVLVAGEPGSGKTRLVAELACAASAEDVTVLVGRCVDAAAAPYQPFVEALRADAGATPDSGLDARLGVRPGELARLVPELAERTGQCPSPDSTRAELDRHRLFDAVAGWLEAAATPGPLLLVLEDLHVATRPTLQLLRHILNATAGAALVVVATYRDTTEERSGEFTDTLAELATHPDVTRLELGGLTADGVAQLVEDTIGADARLASELHAVTTGNPLFVQELLAGLRSGAITGLTQLRDPDSVPWTLRQLTDARVQRLAPATVRLLEQAAVAGATFPFGPVAEAAMVAEDAALDALDEAIRARLVTAVEPRHDRYSFSHALMRSALLGRVSPSRRMRLHAQLATALEQHHAGDLDRVLGELAYHHGQAGPAGNPAKARRFARSAGDVALSQLAYDEAAACYEQALDLFDPADRDRPVVEQRCDLLIALGDAQQRAGPGVHSITLRAALNLAVELGDPERAARAAWAHNRGFPGHLSSVDGERVAVLERALDVVGSDAPGPRATVLAVLAGELAFASDRAWPRRLSDEALALARRADDAVLAQVLSLRQFTIQGPDTVAERLAATGELVQLADRLDDANLQVFARWWRAVAALEAGDRAEVDARVPEACRLADELGEPFMMCASRMLAANRELAWGELDNVAKLADRYREFGRLADAADIDGPYLFHHLWLHRERGDLAEALPHLEELYARFADRPHAQAMMARSWWEVGSSQQALAVLDRFAADSFGSVPITMMWLQTLCPLAEVAAAAGRAADARVLLDQLAPHAEQLAADPALCGGSVAHYCGLLATTLADWGRAEDYLELATRTQERLGAARWVNRSRLAHAQLLLARGDPGDRDAADDLLRATGACARSEGQMALTRTCDDLRLAGASRG